MTLYRGQPSIYDNEPFVPVLLRDNAIQKIEESIRKETGIIDLDFYKSELSDCIVSKCVGSCLHSDIAEKDHLYYFFLSFINIALQVHRNFIFESNFLGYFEDFVTYNKERNEFTLSSPKGVRDRIAHCLTMETIFDGYYLRDYSFFQHLNFIFSGIFPTMLLDWISDIDIAAFFSQDHSGNFGTVVSMKFPNELYPDYSHYSGTTNILTHQSAFFNAFGYACDHYDNESKTNVVNMSNGKQFTFQKHNSYHQFNQSLITLQKATCLYWPYKKYTLNQLEVDTKLKDVLGFTVFRDEELKMKIYEENAKQEQQRSNP
jgi:hypothetical protein